MNTNIKIHQLIVTFSHLLYIEQFKKNGKNQSRFLNHVVIFHLHLINKNSSQLRDLLEISLEEKEIGKPIYENEKTKYFKSGRSSFKPPTCQKFTKRPFSYL
jgi:hypothetical protein